jgi:hypothetical protein
MTDNGLDIAIPLVIIALTAIGTGVYKLQSFLERWDQQRHFKD